MAVEVEAVIPGARTSEPCYEAEVVELARQVEGHASSGDVGWLKQYGEVCAAMGAM